MDEADGPELGVILLVCNLLVAEGTVEAEPSPHDDALQNINIIKTRINRIIIVLGLVAYSNNDIINSRKKKRASSIQ